ncbi:MAG: DUF3276 family protein [Bacteroidota bacterium]
MEVGQSENRMKKKRVIFSKTIRAGKRTYFFDVKSTQRNELYLTITESRKRFNNFRKSYYFEQYKVFLYCEDFDKFDDAFSETIEYIRSNQKKDGNKAGINHSQYDGHEYDDNEHNTESEYTNVDFEDLHTEYNQNGEENGQNKE